MQPDLRSAHSSAAGARRASLRRVLYGFFALTCLFFVLWYVLYTASRSVLWDFGVFFGSAQAVLHGQSMYQVYGQEQLPYWYFPWVAWMFIPLAVLPVQAAKIVYLALGFLGAIWLVFVAGRRLGGDRPFSANVFILAMGLLACWLLFRVGQADFILAALVTAIVFMIEGQRDVLAGALFPVLLFKPHLLLVFIPVAIWRGGRRFLVSACISVLLLSLLGVILIPDWPVQMIGMLRHSGLRTDNAWGFTTLPELIGRTENWSGTANLPITLGLFALGLGIAWKNRHLPTAPLLSLTMALSLLCAPRAYSYNLPFLLPALLWLSPSSVLVTTIGWLAVGAIAFGTSFSTGSYVIVLITCGLAVAKSLRLRAPALEPQPT